MNVPLTCSFSSPDSAGSLDGTGSQIVTLLSCKLDITAHLQCTKAGNELWATANWRQKS